jgi:hypothetical protein
MKSKRTSVAFLLATFGGLLLFANCTVKTVDGGDTCTKGETSTCSCGTNKGNQTCTSKGTWGVCECGSVNNNGGSSNNAGEGNASGTTNKAGNSGGGTTSNGGTTSYAGDTTAGGEPPVANGGAGGEGGAGPVIDPADCDSCLQQLCPNQMTTCLNNDVCLNQYASISACIEDARKMGLVKRDAVRGCGVTIGQSADPDVIDAWAPEGMDPDTTALINCMAGGMPDAPTADWANNDANFPNGVPAPWPMGTCAKLACTSMK